MTPPYQLVFVSRFLFYALFCNFSAKASAKPPKALLLKGLRPDSRAFFHRSQFENREPAGNISTDAARRKIKIVGKARQITIAGRTVPSTKETL